MKKLMLTVAIVCAAVCANAAAVDWSASNVGDPWATAAAGSNKPANGWLGYMIMAADYATVTTDLAAGKTDSLLAAAVGPTKTSTNKGAFSTSGATGNVAAGNQAFYLIVLNAGNVNDATHYYASAEVPWTVDSSLDTNVTLGKQAASLQSSSWNAMAPEPTSGLLLLLGMAGLALKRKQA